MAIEKNTPTNKDDILELLLDKVNKLEKDVEELKRNQIPLQPFQPFQVFDVDLCTDGNDHEYPMPWHSITPAPCKKCGKQAEQYPISYDTTTGDVPWDFKEHGGNVMNNENPIITHDSNSKYISDTSGIF